MASEREQAKQLAGERLSDKFGEVIPADKNPYGKLLIQIRKISNPDQMAVALDLWRAGDFEGAEEIIRKNQ